MADSAALVASPPTPPPESEPSPKCCHETIRQLLLQQQHKKGQAASAVGVLPTPLNGGSVSSPRLVACQMLQLAAATAQCEADGQRRAAVLELVGRLLAAAFPAATTPITLHCFGSSANGLGTSDSDLDIHLGEIMLVYTVQYRKGDVDMRLSFVVNQ